MQTPAIKVISIKTILKNFFRLGIFTVSCILFYRADSLYAGDDITSRQTGSVMSSLRYFPNDGSESGGRDKIYSVYGNEDISILKGGQMSMRLNTRFNLEQNINRLSIDDLYFDYYTDNFEIRFGYQIISWKAVESFSPIDILNQRNYELDPFNPDKIGEPAVRVSYTITSGFEHMITVYGFPWFQKAILPQKGNNYYLFSDKPDIILDTENAIYDSPQKNQRLQGAIQYSSPMNGFADLKLFYFNGYRKYPLFEFVPVSGTQIKAFERYPIVHATGASFQKALEQYVLSSEIIFTKYRRQVISPAQTEIKNYSQYALGMERNFASILGSGNDAVLIAELIGDSGAGKKNEEIESGRFYRSNLLLGLRYVFNDAERKNIQVSYLLDYLKFDTYLRLKYNQQLFKYIAVELFADGFMSVKSVELKPFEHTQKIGFALGYKW